MRRTLPTTQSAERFGVNARARQRPSRSTPCSTAAPTNHEAGSPPKCPFVVCQSNLRYFVWVKWNAMLTADLPDQMTLDDRDISGDGSIS
jgi:hypothetical protein